MKVLHVQINWTIELRKANQTFLCAIWNKWVRLHFTEMSVRAGASEADGDPNYSRVQYVTWTTLRAASTPAPSLLTSGRLHIYHILTMGEGWGAEKRDWKHAPRQATARNCSGLTSRERLQKNPMRPCDANGKPRTDHFPSLNSSTEKSVGRGACEAGVPRTTTKCSA